MNYQDCPPQHYTNVPGLKSREKIRLARGSGLPVERGCGKAQPQRVILRGLWIDSIYNSPR